jgi:predicted acyltransferase
MAVGADKAQRLNDRLMSLDFFRGVTMFLLIAEATGLYDVLAAPSVKETFIGAIGAQFQHRAWSGLHLWDLGQPFFMFISGVAMVFSYGKRWERGSKWAATFRHALGRSLLLCLFGWAIYFIDPAESGNPGAFLYDVLPQLSFACLIAFLIMRKSFPVQLTVSLGLLVATELLYRLWQVPGFNQPFIPDHNFGSYVDLLLTGKLSDGHWVAFNAVPLTALAIWGVLAGHLLRNQMSPARKMRTLLSVGLIGVATGLALSPLTPIIRKISTSSFVILAGGLGFLALALSYWLIDVLSLRKWAKFFVIVGMNPLFIYLFSQMGGAEWFERIVSPFAQGLLGWRGEWVVQAATGFGVLTLLWYLCYWLYRREIIIRI